MEPVKILRNKLKNKTVRNGVKRPTKERQHLWLKFYKILSIIFQIWFNERAA